MANHINITIGKSRVSLQTSGSISGLTIRVSDDHLLVQDGGIPAEDDDEE